MRILVPLARVALALLCALPAGAQTADELLRRCDPANVEATAAQLRQRGAPAAEACITLLVQGGEGATAASNAAALAALPAFLDELREALAGTTREGSPVEKQRGLDVLGSVGFVRDLTLALELAAAYPLCQNACVSETARADLRGSATRIVARHLKDLAGIEQVLEHCPTEFMLPMLDALAANASREGLVALGRLLEGVEPSSGLLLVAIGRMARTVPAPHDPQLRASVRWILERDGGSGFREAVLCAGALDDELAVEPLIGLLEHENPGVRLDALWSLERITGTKLGPRKERWTNWCREQELWWDNHARARLEDLGSRDGAVRGAALNELLRRRFPRHPLARGLAEKLEVLKGADFQQACATLEGLGSPAALEPLRQIDRKRLGAPQQAALEKCLAKLAPQPPAR